MYYILDNIYCGGYIIQFIADLNKKISLVVNWQFFLQEKVRNFITYLLAAISSLFLLLLLNRSPLLMLFRFSHCSVPYGREE